MEALSAAASVVGVAAATAHLARIIYTDIESIRKAPKALRDLKSDLGSLSNILDSLSNKAQDLALIIDRNVERILTENLSSCQASCQSLRDTIHKLTKHSVNGVLSKRDRISIGWWEEKSLESYGKQLMFCKTGLTLTLSAIEMLSEELAMIKQQLQENRETCIETKTELVRLSGSSTIITSNEEVNEDPERSQIQDHLATLEIEKQVAEKTSATCKVVQQAVGTHMRQQTEKVEVADESNNIVGIYSPVQDLPPVKEQTVGAVKVGVKCNNFVGIGVAPPGFFNRHGSSLS
ncbi:hypothetical protein TWF696_003135 [Orbilia brochopaga]|uniref:Azaphilone pigments biosynthesis cluster protein L N-terminal domain-containing protein n=1 Tax=Orbilia brochopaga TaxID=3140254 RepID=A0AAV9TZR1_9PEZI